MLLLSTVNATNSNFSNNFEVALKLANYAICINLIYNTFPEEAIEFNTNFTYQIFEKPTAISHQRVQEAYIIIHEHVYEIVEVLTYFQNYARKLNTYFVIIPRLILNATDVEKVFKANQAVRLKYLFLLQEDGIFVRNHYKAHVEVFDETALALEVLNSGNYNAEELSVTMFHTEPSVLKIGNEYKGIDPSVINTFARKLNFTVKYLEPPEHSRYGARLQNGTTSGAIRELYTRNAEITGNQVFLKWYNTPELVFTTTVVSDTLCVVVPKAATFPVWMNLFWIYTWEIWLVLGVNVLLFYVSLFLIRKMSNHVLNNIASDVFVDVTRMVFNFPQHRKYLNVSDRIFQASILLFVTIFATTFQSSLVTVVKLPKAQTEINTLEELDKSSYIPTTSSIGLLDTFSNSTSHYMQSLDRKLTLLENSMTDPQSYLERKTKMGVFQDMDRVLTGKTDTHIVRECPKEYLLSYMVRNDALFLEDLNKVLSGIFEGGLVRKWDGELVRLFLSLRRNQIVKKDSVIVDDSPGFSLNDMQMSFYYWILGCLFSLVVLIFEIRISKK